MDEAREEVAVLEKAEAAIVESRDKQRERVLKEAMKWKSFT